VEMSRKGTVSRRFSTGDIKIYPTGNSGGNNSQPSSLRRAGGGSRHNSPPNSASKSPRNKFNQRGSGRSPSPSPLRKKTPSVLSRANSFQGLSTKQSTKKVSRVSVNNFNLSKDQEKLEEDLIQRRSKSIRKHPGPEARELRTRFPSKHISSDIDKMSIITNHIVLGSKRDASNKAKLDNLGITHILNMAQQVPNFHPNEYIYHKINILDAPTTDITESYASASSFISRVERVKGRVLVHCVSGVSRSVSVVIMHFIGKYQMALKNAYNHIHAARPYIHPNNGFKYQLAMFELEYLQTSSIVGNAGEAWNFYEWNCVKSQYRHQSVDGSEGVEKDICCCIS